MIPHGSQRALGASAELGVGSGDRIAVRVPTWVGDAVASIPSINLLLRAAGTVQCLGPQFARDLMPVGVRYAVVNGRTEERERLEALEIDSYLLLRSSFGAALCARSRGRSVVGFAANHRRALLSFHIPYPQRVARATAFLGLTEAALEHWRVRAPEPREPAVPRLDLDAGEVAAARTLLGSAELVPGRFLVCCPMAAVKPGRPNWKRWPHFARLSRALAAAGVDHASCPGPEESEECAGQLPFATILQGTSLRQSAAIMRLSAGVISNDTGPMHLAAATGVATIGLFGDTDPVRFGGAAGPDVRNLGTVGAWPDLAQVWWQARRLTVGFAS